jgi:hypothetical protein
VKAETKPRPTAWTQWHAADFVALSHIVLAVATMSPNDDDRAYYSSLYLRLKSMEADAFEELERLKKRNQRMPEVVVLKNSKSTRQNSKN